MVITRTVHQNAKELLLYIAIILAAKGATVIDSDLWVGVILLGLAFVAVFGRGIYKKFLNGGTDDEKLPTP